MTKALTDMTKSKLIQRIKQKTKGAHRFAKTVFYRGLKHKTKPELIRIARGVHVRDGDIDLTRV